MTTEQDVNVRGGENWFRACPVVCFGIGFAVPSFSGTTGFVT
jgi:hypothetical protein